jgi:hypothetical protein
MAILPRTALFLLRQYGDTTCAGVIELRRRLAPVRHPDRTGVIFTPMNTPAPVPQSSFVTVLAVIMLVFGALGVLVGLLQNILLNFVLPQLEAAMSQAGPVAAVPLVFFRVTMVLALAFSVFMTYAAYALLKRRNWARMMFIVLFVVSAVLHVIVAALFGLGFGLASLSGSGAFPVELQSAVELMTIAFAVFMVAMAVMYVWLVFRLRSPAIAAEFGVVTA